MKNSSKSGKKASCRPAQATFHSTLRSEADVHKALEQCDALRVERHSDEPEAARLVVRALDDFIYDAVEADEDPLRWFTDTSQRLKPVDSMSACIAAVNRCATQGLRFWLVWARTG